jgi:DNA-3-methyladenine glycosylase I
MMEVHTGEDGLDRCWWGMEPEIYRVYHDEEWGRPTTEDHRLFEKICLEGFQAGLSWLTILRKRENFRSAFSGFDPARIAEFDESDVNLLLGDTGIVRHQGKIRSTINNAVRAIDLIEEQGSLAAYFWSRAEPETSAPVEIPAITEASTALSKDLKKRGWSFVGPTTVYAFMQAMGLVNDHLPGCHVRPACVEERRRVMGDRL